MRAYGVGTVGDSGVSESPRRAYPGFPPRKCRLPVNRHPFTQNTT